MIPRVLYPLLPYRSFLYPILVLGAIVVPLWVVVRLYRLRTRRQPLSLPRELLLLAFVFYLSAVAAATLTPNRSDRLVAEGRGAVVIRPSMASLTCSSASLPAGSTAQAFCLHNARGNVMLFFPLGILLPLVWPRLHFIRGIGIAAALSASIELLQFLSSALGSYRSADVNDVILNVAGAGLGLALMTLLQWRPRARAEVVRA